MDLQELHERSGVSRRRLRYCLDHGLVPGLNIELTPDRAGRPRKFAPDAGFGILCAATLLELGLPHETIRHFLRGLLEVETVVQGRKQLALAWILERSVPATAHLGDGLNVRLIARDAGLDSGWLSPGRPGKLAASYGPVAEVVLDLDRIRQRVFARPAESA